MEGRFCFRKFEADSLRQNALCKVALALAVCLFTSSVANCPAFAQSPEGRTIILVADFVNQTGDPKWDGVGIGIANSISVKLGNISSISVTNEDTRRRVMAEQRFGQSGFADLETAVETGKLAGATHIAYGTYALAENQLFAFAYIANCKTGLNEGGVESYANTNSTASLINEISLGIVSKLGASTTQTENSRIQREDIGKNIDTLALLGKAEKILFDERGYSRRNLSRSELEQAKSLFEQVIGVEPQNVDALNSLGVIWNSNYGLGDDNKAIYYYRKALEIDPNYAAAHNNLGNALSDKGDLDGAIASHQKALAINPNSASAHNNLGAALSDKGDYDGAIASYRRALAIDPNLALAHNNLGSALYRKGDIDGAIASFRKAIAIDPNYARAHYNLGALLLDKGDLDGAIASYRKVIEVDPNYSSAHINFGVALRKKGDIDGAIASYRKALAVDPYNAIAWAGLGICYIILTDYEQAKYAFDEAMRYSKEGDEAYNMAALFLAMM